MGVHLETMLIKLPAEKVSPVAGMRPILRDTKFMPRAEGAMSGIQFVTDGKGRKTAVLIDLKKHGAALEDFWDP